MSSSLRNRVPSTSCWFPEQTTRRQYHSKCCVINSAKGRVKSAVDERSNNYDQLQKNNVVIQDEIWKNSCSKEKSREEKW